MLANVTLLAATNGGPPLSMPLVGFGCAGRLGPQVLREALSAGYGLFDTAQAAEWYDEAALGEALAPFRGPPVFVTTKVHPRDFGTRSTAKAIDESLARLRQPAVDLLMLHYASCWESLCAGSPPPEGDWREAWRALEVAHDAGRARTLGVSNFDVRELEQLWAHARVRPAVVQSWMDPFHQNAPVREWCARRGVVFQAYSTLGTQHGLGTHAQRANPVLGSAVIGRIAQRLGRSEAQVVLRWALDHGVAVLPRSSDAARMRENLRLFDFALEPGDRSAIDALDGTDPALAERSEAAKAGLALTVRFENGLDQQVSLRWGDAAEPAWSIAPRASLELQSFAGHLFSASLEDAAGTEFWRWTVPAAEEQAAAQGGGGRGADLVVTIAPPSKQEL